MPEWTSRRTHRLLIGIIVITIGTLFMLDNLGLTDANDILRWWPALLLGYGFLRLTGLLGRQSLWVGLIFSIAGGWMLLSEAGLVHRDVWALWPVLLILWGIAVIRGGSTIWRFGYFPRRARFRRDGSVASGGAVFGAMAEKSPGKQMHEDFERLEERIHKGVGQDTAATFAIDVFMSNVTRKVMSQEFTGGHVTALMGGADVDLRSARMAGSRATLEANLVMGGLNVFVPEDWAVEFDGSPIMGNVEDQTRRPIGEAQKVLLVTGSVLMSSVFIKN